MVESDDVVYCAVGTMTRSGQLQNLSELLRASSRRGIYCCAGCGVRDFCTDDSFSFFFFRVVKSAYQLNQLGF